MYASSGRASIPPECWLKGTQAFPTTRGVTRAVVDEARTMLAQLSKVAAAPISQASVVEQEAELERAEEALWAWYLEWSKVTRVAIKQRAMLRQLGFLTRRASEEDPAEAPAPGRVPAPASTSGASY